MAYPLRKLPDDWTAPLFNAEDEAALYHRPGPAFFSVLYQDGATKKQQSFRTRDMAQVMRLMPKDRDTWISQAQFVAPTRRAVHMESVSLLFVDIDCYKLGLSPAQAEGLLLLYCNENGFPPPSLIVRSGRGIQVKWLLDKPLPGQALPRWNAAQRELVARFENIGGDRAACDISRVLRASNTVNTKSGEVVHVSWANWSRPGETETYGFDYLCEFLLPFTREQIAQMREERAQAKAARRAALKIVEGGGNPTWLHRFNWRQLAWDRTGDMRTLHRIRQGNVAGASMPMLFWTVNFLLQSGATNSNQMWHEADALCREFGFGQFNRKSELSTLYAKAKEHEAGKTVTYNGKTYGALYRVKNSTLIDLFQITDDEQRQLRTIISEDEAKARHRKREEKRRREAGAVTREQYLSAVGADVEQKRVSARLMRATGMTQRAIAAELGVTDRTVRNWLAE